MIRIDLDIEMPRSCEVCPLQDDEFQFCHGKLYRDRVSWECDDYDKARPEWCPLLEVRKKENMND